MPSSNKLKNILALLIKKEFCSSIHNFFQHNPLLPLFKIQVLTTFNFQNPLSSSPNQISRPTKHDMNSYDTGKQKSIDRELKELVSAINTRLGSIQWSQLPGGSTNHNQDDEDQQEVKIITLTGTNLGATMRGNMDEKPVMAPQGLTQPEQEDLATYVNSNFQAINNSIMLGGSYETNDPGVHLDISDYYEHGEIPKHGKKVGKNKRRSSKSDHHVETSDNDRK